MAACGNGVERQLKFMYGTVLNHTYEGQLKKTSDVKNPNDYGKWDHANTTYLVCKVDNDDPILISNAYGNHAEANLINKLIQKGKVKISSGEKNITDWIEELLTNQTTKNPNDTETKKITVTIFINNSPCSLCADKLIKMLESNVQVKLKLYVASLYYIKRNSCNEEYHNECVPPHKHKSNFNGLKKLMLQARCEIEAFTKDVWEELFNIMDLSPEVKTKLVDDYGHVTDDNDRSRESEDNRIKEDLFYIRTRSFERKKSKGQNNGCNSNWDLDYF